MKRASILNIGTELLVGHTVNTHANYLSRELNALGYSVYYHFTVGDNMERIKGALKFLKEESSDLIIITGGLGPTADDITRQAVAEFNGLELVENQEARDAIDKYYFNRGTKASENNYLQALFPKNAIMIKNDYGTAPGFFLEADGTKYACLPGPPRELYGMFPDFVDTLWKGQEKLYSKFICMNGIREADCANLIDDIFNSQTDPSIGIYAEEGLIKLRLSTFKKNQAEADASFEPIIQQLKERISDFIFSYDNEKLEEVLIRILRKKNLRIAFAESMTGGFIAKRFTDIAGASIFFEYGLVTYSDRAKADLLNISPSLIEKHGAVSEEVALAMLEGIYNKSGADICLSITGYASKSEGLRDDEVGLFYIGYKIGDRTYVKKYKEAGDRERIRNTAVNRAFFELFKALEV